jgi:ATP-binding cassette subfamily B multidrug efflux pump
MFERTFRWFETRIDPYAPADIVEPPKGLAAFFWHYLKPVWWAFALLTVLTLAAAAIEVALIAFIGRIIDLMRDTAWRWWRSSSARSSRCSPIYRSSN